MNRSRLSVKAWSRGLAFLLFLALSIHILSCEGRRQTDDWCSLVLSPGYHLYMLIGAALQHSLSSFFRASSPCEGRWRRMAMSDGSSPTRRRSVSARHRATTPQRTASSFDRIDTPPHEVGTGSVIVLYFAVQKRVGADLFWTTIMIVAADEAVMGAELQLSSSFLSPFLRKRLFCSDLAFSFYYI